MRELYTIANEISKDWKNVSPYALPYLKALGFLSTVDDMYYLEDGRSMVRYFLSNAQGWKGTTARKIKLELKGMLK